MTFSDAPSRWRRAWQGTVSVGAGLAAATGCFLVLPLLEAISMPEAADLVVLPVDTAVIAPPPPPPENEQEEKKPEPEVPPPALAEVAPPLDLAQLELALDPHAGGMDGAGDFAVRLPGVAAAAGSGVDELFSLADLDQKPRVLWNQPPQLSAALKKKVPATVHIVFVVDANGRVQDPVVQSSSDAAFDAPALAAIRQWKFEPGKRGGQPVRFRMRQPMSFQ